MKPIPLEDNAYSRALEHLKCAAEEMEKYVGTKENPGPATDAEVKALSKAAPLMIMAALAIYKAALIGRKIEGRDD